MAVCFAEQRPVCFDVLTSVGAIPEAIDVLADVSGPILEASIKIDESRAQSSRDQDTRGTLAGSSWTNQRDRNSLALRAIPPDVMVNGSRRRF
jgi:hypothetical protein